MHIRSKELHVIMMQSANLFTLDLHGKQTDWWLCYSCYKKVKVGRLASECKWQVLMNIQTDKGFL
jgi:hypothetical protein